jgi:hypothetical protein
VGGAGQFLVVEAIHCCCGQIERATGVHQTIKLAL